MPVLVYNSLTRRKEELVPRDPPRIGMYVCGPTVYNHIHVGNARASVVFDVIRRYLGWRGFEVTFVMNYTDIDDKIIAKAGEEGRSPEEVAAGYSAAFEKVMAELRVLPPDVLVKATEHIPQMIAMIEGLVAKGVAYESGGSVWFAVEKFAGYGKLSGRSIEDLKAGERVGPDPSKRHPLDFALWKAAKPGEPEWESPWGPGRPGWHIECSAMSLEHLGMGFDVHGGGADLIFPHHENEIAQSECYLGTEPFVRYWLHNGMVRIDEEKMSKSLGNIILLKDFLATVKPQVARVLNLSSHYRGDTDFGEEELTNARGVYERFEIFHLSARKLTDPSDPSEEGGAYLDRFREAMDDDFNAPAALSVLHDLVKQGNREMEPSLKGERSSARRLGSLLGAFNEICGVLGILPEGIEDQAESEEIEQMIEARDRARSEGRYEEGDAIRRALADRGVILEDTPAGTRWRKI